LTSCGAKRRSGAAARRGRLFAEAATEFAVEIGQVAKTNDIGDVGDAQVGVTTGGTIGATSAKSLDDCVEQVDAIARAARSVRKDVIVLCHGGPISMPDDARYLLERIAGLNGFYGASSMERLPAEKAIAEQTRSFKAIGLRKAKRARTGKQARQH
jgi:predicted TIM-barrel enzyme